MAIGFRELTAPKGIGPSEIRTVRLNTNTIPLMCTKFFSFLQVLSFLCVHYEYTALFSFGEVDASQSQVLSLLGTVAGLKSSMTKPKKLYAPILRKFLPSIDTA